MKRRRQRIGFYTVILKIILISQSIFFAYFVSINLIYFILNLIAAKNIVRHYQIGEINPFPQSFLGFEPPISVLVPAHNEEKIIVETIRSLLQLTYSNYEIIIINDGSRDKTVEVLIKEFSLVLFPESFPQELPTEKVRAVYRSKIYPQLKLVDKEKGGKADALNAGINLSHYPLVCTIDADSILQRNSLHLVAIPFLEDSLTIASGGIVRIVNGCEIKEGYLIKTGLPWKFLVNFQVIEYLRAFLFGRLGWSPMNALMVISGAFGLFKKRAVIEAGGYLVGTVGEDMEIVVRLHRLFKYSGKPYRISYVPDPICWTEAPETLSVLRKQRLSWQRGISESLTKNMKLLFYPKGGAVSWLAFPYMIFFEWLGPFIEMGGYLITLLAYFFGYLSLESLLVFLFAAIGMGLMLSTSTLFLEEISYRIYSGGRNFFLLIGAAILENFGYRQLNSFWRLQGILWWLIHPTAERAEIERVGRNQNP